MHQEQVEQQTPAVVKLGADGKPIEQTTTSSSVVRVDWKEPINEVVLFEEGKLSSRIVTVTKAVQSDGMIRAGCIRAGKKILPNTKCVCGSGKKYKKCCGNK